MEINDDFVSLREFEDDKKAIFQLLDAGIKNKTTIYVISSRSSTLFKLSPSQINFILSHFPSKVNITIEKEKVTKLNVMTEKYYSENYNYTQLLSASDLWIKKSDVEDQLKKPTVKSLSVSETERATMLKLILGMAMGAYQYDPDDDRNNATGSNKGSIKYDLEKFGLTIDGNTVRKYLVEAKAMFPHVKCKDNKKVLQDK